LFGLRREFLGEPALPDADADADAGGFFFLAPCSSSAADDELVLFGFAFLPDDPLSDGGLLMAPAFVRRKIISRSDNQRNLKAKHALNE
jgi:hypothetical protein